MIRSRGMTVTRWPASTLFLFLFFLFVWRERKMTYQLPIPMLSEGERETFVRWIQCALR